MRKDLSEALELAGRLPIQGPDLERVRPLPGRLRPCVKFLTADVEEAIQQDCRGFNEREIAWWLLARVEDAVKRGPRPDACTAAVYLEDEDLNTRALAAICAHLLEAGQLVAIARGPKVQVFAGGRDENGTAVVELVDSDHAQLEAQSGR